MTTALGRRQALMKLALPGDPHEIFVILDEGGQVAEVKVIQIDAANRNVSVLNGEKWQMLFLEVSDPASPTSVQQ
jgi:hypothetical protein